MLWSEKLVAISFTPGRLRMRRTRVEKASGRWPGFDQVVVLTGEVVAGQHFGHGHHLALETAVISAVWLAICRWMKPVTP